MHELMDKKTKEQLLEVFGGFVGTSTGSVLLNPSKLSSDLVVKVAEDLDISQVLSNLGELVAKSYVDSLEQQKLAARDIVDTQVVSLALARRIAKELMKSEEFTKRFFEHVKERGGWRAFLKVPFKA